MRRRQKKKHKYLVNFILLFIISSIIIWLEIQIIIETNMEYQYQVDRLAIKEDINNDNFNTENFKSENLNNDNRTFENIVETKSDNKVLIDESKNNFIDIVVNYDLKNNSQICIQKVNLQDGYYYEINFENAYQYLYYPQLNDFSKLEIYLLNIVKLFFKDTAKDLINIINFEVLFIPSIK